MNWQKYFLDMGSMINHMTDGHMRDLVVHDALLENMRKSSLFKNSKVYVKRQKDEDAYSLKINVGWIKFSIIVLKYFFRREALHREIKSILDIEPVRFLKVQVIP
jgi:hypothetical protein